MTALDDETRETFRRRRPAAEIDVAAVGGDPAATQARTASRTDGTAPPREFRTVATLLTLTDKWTITRNAKCKFQNAKLMQDS
jgi:hypothetical protein